MNYLHYFESQSDFDQERQSNYIEPWVSYTEGHGIDYNKSDYEKMADEYLTFDITGNGNICWTATSLSRGISYSKNNGDWVSCNPGTTINVVSGDKVRFKGTNSYYYNYIDDKYVSFKNTTCQFKIYGNILSMQYGDDFKSYTTMRNTDSDLGDFGFLFCYCTNLTDASKLILPKTVNYHCYESMFEGCSNLVATPILPATVLESGCYRTMFKDCTSLITAPELLATTLNTFCYYGMFRGCTSLIEAPTLLATTLSSSCYQYMFYGCTSLNYIKAMFTTTPSNSYTYNWVYNVSSTGTFVKNSNAEWNVTGTNGIPTSWTVQTASS